MSHTTRTVREEMETIHSTWASLPINREETVSANMTVRLAHNEVTPMRARLWVAWFKNFLSQYVVASVRTRRPILFRCSTRPHIRRANGRWEIISRTTGRGQS